MEQFVHCMAKINHTLKERLTAKVEETGKTQRKIATELGMEPRTLNYYCNGREADRATLERIAAHIGTNRLYLVGDSDDPAPTSTAQIHKPLTPGPNNGTGSKEGNMVDVDLYRSLLRIENNLDALRQDMRQLSERVILLETGGSNRPTKGRKAKS